MGYFVIGDDETVTGFRLAGVEGRAARTPPETREALKVAAATEGAAASSRGSRRLPKGDLPPESSLQPRRRGGGGCGACSSAAAQSWRPAEPTAAAGSSGGKGAHPLAPTLTYTDGCDHRWRSMAMR